MTKSRGFTLIEVLVAMVVLGIGLLGVATLQFTSVKGAQDAYTRSQASFLAYAVTDAMRANLAVARAGGYDIAIDAAPAAAVPCIGAARDCTPAQLAAFDLVSWKQDLAQVLVGGAGSIDSEFDAVTGTATVSVRVAWQSMRGDGSAEALLVVLEL